MLDAVPEMRQRLDHVVVEAIMRRLLRDPDGANIKDYLRVISQSWADSAVRVQREMERAHSEAKVPPTLARLRQKLTEQR